MADSTTPSLRRRLAVSVGVGAAAVTMVAGLVVTTSLWAAEQSNIVDRAELHLLDQIDLARTVNGDVVLAPTSDAEFAVAFAADRVVAVSGDVVEEVAAAIIDEVSTYPDPGDDFLSVAELTIAGSLWAIAYATCLDATVCDTLGVAVMAPPWSDFVISHSAWIAFAAMAVTGVASTIAVLLVSRSLHPVEAMRRELAATTATDLSRRVPVSRSGDEIEALGVTLNNTLDRLESAVMANERFVADAAHELRSPLAGVRAAVELRVGPDSNDLLREALGELDRASTLIDDLLFLAKGRQPGVMVEDIALDELVADEVEVLRSRSPGVTVTTDLASVVVRTNRVRMSRVVQNLLENAARYGAGSIDVALRVDGGEAELWIDDNGEGISESDRVRVFDRFVRLDASRSRSTGGSGLGLAIVREIVEDNRGTVALEEAPAGGARFNVRLPIG